MKGQHRHLRQALLLFLACLKQLVAISTLRKDDRAMTIKDAARGTFDGESKLRRDLSGCTT
jgi:hypothetical protein